MAEWRSVLSGVPQGSVLGPLMFLLFINDLSCGLKTPIRLFADDAKIIGNASTQEEQEILQADINACATWARTWLMLFNIAKCKVMHVGRGSNKSSYEYTMPDKDGTPCPLEVTHLERDLGVLISDDLKLEAQCRAAAARARWQFGILKQVIRSRNKQIWEILYKNSHSAAPRTRHPSLVASLKGRYRGARKSPTCGQQAYQWNEGP